ncbi:MAG: twin-arginine translocase subunit TatC [Bernardetiaceae bacterium]|nr:twin-arginine translocase subunit TatC [Bernardetiaceae bacterium]
MTVIDHLEDLRWGVIRSMIAIIIFTAVAFMATEFVFGVLILGPSRTDFWSYQILCEISDKICIDKLPFTIQSRKLTGQFTMHIAASLTFGFICAFPYVFWEFWRFISPGLYISEKQVARGATFFVSLLFALGVLFGYYILTPLSINFLSNYQVDPSIINEFDISSYVTTVAMLTLACGIIFQLPMVVLFLSQLGIVTPALMKVYRRHTIIGVLFFSALITPPDIISQCFITLPIMLLYEISIFISRIVNKRRIAKLES